MASVVATEHRRRRVVSTAGSLFLVLAVLGGGLAVTPGRAAAATTVTVSPSTGLLPNQLVSVAGTGFLRTDYLLVTQCSGAQPTLYDCTLSGEFAFPNASGEVSVTLRVVPSISASGHVVDCRAQAGACSVAIFSSASPLTAAGAVPIAFDSTVPLPVPRVTATPAAGLVDRQSVTVHGEEFPPTASVTVRQCGTPSLPGCPSYQQVTVSSDASGSFDMTMPVRIIWVADAQRADCREPGACVITASTSAAGGHAASTPISFDPDASLPAAPVVTIEPAGELVDRQVVTLRGTGFTPATWVSLAQCAAAGVPIGGPCVGGPPTQLTTDAEGTFTTRYSVRREIADPSGGPSLDCAPVPGACVIWAGEFYDQLQTALVPLTFDPDEPTIPPSVAASPTTGLADLQVLRVTGSGFVPSASVWLRECVAPAPTSITTGRCAPIRVATPDATGALLTGYRARRTIVTMANGVTQSTDCAQAAGTCVLVVQPSTEPINFVAVPLEFDPNAPPAPPPVLRASPSAGLRDGDTVTVRGEGFIPGATVVASICVAGTFIFGCEPAAIEGGKVDGNGRATIDVIAHEHIQPIGFPATDCGAAPGACVVGIVDLGDITAVTGVPISFGPIASLHGVRVRERDGETRVVRVPISLSDATTRALDLTWSTTDRSAIAGRDYTAASGTVHIPAGATTGAIEVLVRGDRRRERDETFTVKLQSVTGGSIHPRRSAARVTIVDDDTRRGSW